MATPNKALRAWLDAATPDQTRELAKAAKTSVLQLRHLAAGRRKASAALAQRIAHASLWKNGIQWPRPLDQRELCEACGRCPFATELRDGHL